MALVSSSIPNLINGISQQPAEIRLSSQCERQINGLSTVARGLEKRPGTVHQARISTTSETDLFIHSIRRDRTEEYTTILSRTSGGVKDIKVYDKEGTEVPVKSNTHATASSATDIVTGDLGYLEVTDTGGVRDNIVATTVADTTFFINKTKVVDKASTTSSGGSGLITGAWTHEGLLFVKGGDYSSKYVAKLVIDLPSAGSPTTYRVGFQTPASNVGLNQKHIGSPNITKILKEGNTSASTDEGAWDDFDSEAPIEGFGGWRCIADRDENGETSGAGEYVAGLDSITTDHFDFSLDQSSSVIKIQAKAAFTIETQDSHGGRDLVGITTFTTSFTNLPGKNAPDGYIVKIVGNADASADDFYVKYQAIDEVWKETIGPSLVTSFDKDTMPHRLIRLYDGSGTKYFLYEPVQEIAVSGAYGARFGWSTREAGDDTSNPFPTFEGGKINDICFHKNRFGVLSDENIIFSEAGNYYNFFPISVMTALDSNPIDISVSNNEVSILTHAAAFDQSLLLFSDFQQFSLNSEGEGFTPATVSVDVVTQFESTSKAPPVSSGKFVYFPFERGEFSGVREYFVDIGSSDTNDATDITAHVPQYIKGNITKLAVSSNDQMIAILSDDDESRIYVYKNFWQGTEKLQNSWSHWTFDGDILNCAFLGSTLKVLIRRDDGIYLEDINLSLDSAEVDMEDDTSVLLDRRVRLSYNQTVAANLPYFADIPSNMVYVTDNAQKLNTIAEVNTYLADSTNTPTNEIFVFAGIPYTFEYEFSRFIHKQNELPVQTAKLQIRNINLLYNKTGFFNLKVNVTPGTINVPNPDTAGASIQITPRKNYEKIFSGILTNTSETGKYKLLSGTFKGSVMTNASNCNIILENNEYLPCSFQSAEWEGFLHLRSQRI